MPFGSYEWCTTEEIEQIKTNIHNIDIDCCSNAEEEKVVCKGITIPARAKLSLKAFRNVVKNASKVYTDIYNIQAKNREMYTQKKSKLALSTSDDKRYLKQCGIHTLPHGSVEEETCSKCYKNKKKSVKIVIQTLESEQLYNSVSITPTFLSGSPMPSSSISTVSR